MSRIAVIDADTDSRAHFSTIITEFGHQSMEFSGLEAALQALAAAPAILTFVDERALGGDIPKALAALKACKRAMRVVVLAADAAHHSTVTAMRYGAFDHLLKPIDRADFAALLARMPPAVAAASTDAGADEIIGNSPASRKLQRRIGRAALGFETVLIRGESGVGKKTVARAIHRFSHRGGGRLMVIHCAGIPVGSLESMLFGQAAKAGGGERRGRFREAAGGTILLDGIHDLAPSTQSRLLRVLQAGEVVPLGGRPVAVDVRVIATTDRDIARLAADGRFRPDLYYHLSVLSIGVPPLRERRQDIPRLARYLLAQFSPDTPPTLSAEAEQALSTYPWPGNGRELVNILRRAARFAPNQVIEAGDLDLGPTPDDALPPPGRLAEILAEAEIGAIRAALARAGGNRAKAARELDISRPALYERLKKYGIEPLTDSAP